jgi:hypothetical protein
VVRWRCSQGTAQHGGTGEALAGLLVIACLLRVVTRSSRLPAEWFSPGACQSIKPKSRGFRGELLLSQDIQKQKHLSLALDMLYELL